MAKDGKSSKPLGVPLNLRMPPDLKRRFRVACADRGVAMTDVLLKCITSFVSDYEHRTPTRHTAKPPADRQRKR